MVTDHKDKAMEVIRIKGPVVPSDLTKPLNLDTMFASAVLSELSRAGLVKISSLKVGGSPLYYAKGQEPMLEKYRKHLNEKDQRTFDLLQEQKVIQDRPQTPLVRVSLRQIKDFAVPITVTTSAGEELFWRWHTLSNEEATPIVKRLMGYTEPKPEVKPEPKKAEPEPEFIEQKPAEKKPESKPKKKAEPKAEQKTLEPIAEAPVKKIDDDFIASINDFFAKNNIVVLQQTIIKKNKESDFIIEVPSPVGKLKYYCRAKNKKAINEGDLSTAYVVGQSKKLPVILLTPGKLSKKAEEMLAGFSGMSVKQL